MKKLGYYYSSSIKTLIIGFIDNRGKLNGSVIGNTFSDEYFASFRYGYKYNSWSEGFVYVGRLTTYTTLNGYMSFLEKASHEQIEGYFLSKSIVMEKHNSYVNKKKFDGRVVKYVMRKNGS